MIRVILHGAGGKMGRAFAALAQETNAISIVAGVDARVAELDFPLYQDLKTVQETADVLLDFSRPDALDNLLKYGLPLVLAATGYSNEDLDRIHQASKQIAIFQSANLSIGVSLLNDLVSRAATVLLPCDVEIVEAHHRAKVDAPSGTALTLAHAVTEAARQSLPYRHGRAPKDPPRSIGEIGIHAIRGGSSVGEHSVLFLLDGETIELRHCALNRDIFARGALRAVQFIAGCEPGLYGMTDLIH